MSEPQKLNKLVFLVIPFAAIIETVPKKSMTNGNENEGSSANRVGDFDGFPHDDCVLPRGETVPPGPRGCAGRMRPELFHRFVGEVTALGLNESGIDGR
jgi:hypothetical protein